MRQVKQPVLSCFDPFLLLYGVAGAGEVMVIVGRRARSDQSKNIPDEFT